MSCPRLFLSPAVFLLASVLGFGLVRGQSPTEPVFTAEQADAGRAIYKERCAACHMADLGGRDDAPALSGDAFLAAWKAKTTTDLFEFIRDTMPPEGPALAPDDALRVASHVLRENGATAGPAPLTATSAVAIGAVATGRKPPAARASSQGLQLARAHAAPACFPSRSLTC